MVSETHNLLDRWQQRHGVAVDVSSAEYANLWLRELPRPGMPLPDLRHWWREPGLYLPLSCAIAFVGSGYTDGTFAAGATPTFSALTTGASIFWAFYINFNSTADSITSVECGSGNNMTKLVSGVTNTHVGLDMSVWYKFSPASGGSTSIIAHQTGSGNWLMQGIAYSGTDTSALGATVLGGETAPAANHATRPITTANANSWVACFTQEQSQAGGLFSGTNSTLRGRMAGFIGCGIFDSGLVASAGAFNLDIGVTTSGYEQSILAEMKVSGGVGGGGAIAAAAEYYSQRRGMS